VAHGVGGEENNGNHREITWPVAEEAYRWRRKNRKKNSVNAAATSSKSRVNMSEIGVINRRQRKAANINNGMAAAS